MSGKNSEMTKAEKAAAKYWSSLGRSWPCYSISMAEYSNCRTIFHLWRTDPSRIDLAECFFIRVIPFIPCWVHPNQITLGTFISDVSCLFLAALIPIYNYEYNKIGDNDNHLIQFYLCILCAFAILGTLMFDALDGMHARATKQASPLG